MCKIRNEDFKKLFLGKNDFKKPIQEERGGGSANPGGWRGWAEGREIFISLGFMKF